MTQRGARREVPLDLSAPLPDQLDLFGGDQPAAIGPKRVRMIGDLFHGQVPAGAIYVGRAAPGLPASPYANPFRVGKNATDRADAVRQYEDWFPSQQQLLTAAQAELAGYDLACWCELDGQPCHGDVLLRLVNAPD
jgi:hypothetical protein